tara:strand:+ start:1042 stop:1293 length:252 start_codon:yes stop_codon:yes gene_type:complete
MITNEDFMTYIFLFAIVVGLICYVLNVCNDYYNTQYDIENTSEDDGEKEKTNDEKLLDIIFAEQFYKTAGRPLKHSVNLRVKI